MKVLITGASGFVGSHLTQFLVDQGLDVHALVRNVQTHFSPKVIQHEGNITHLDSILKASEGCSSIFHLAGLVGYSKSQREEMTQVNVGGTQNIISVMRKQNIPKILHFSSVVAVGASFQPIPLNEDSPYAISHLNLGYFETKRAAERIVLESAQKGDFECVCVNPSTIYGYGDAQKGSRKIHIKVAQGKFPIYPSGGANIIAIEDAISATFKAWQIGKNCERYILSGENLYIKEIFNMIAYAAKVDPPRWGMPKAAIHAIGMVGDALELIGQKGPINSETAWTSTLYHWFDNTKAKKELNLNPRPARTAIENSVQWMKDTGII